MKKQTGLQKIVIDLNAVKDKTIGEVFGTEPQPVTILIKKLWIFIKENNLRETKNENVVQQ